MSSMSWYGDDVSIIGAVEALLGDLRNIVSIVGAVIGWTASNNADFFGE